MKRNKGFTLIELLVVISIIGVLISIALTSFSASQKQARDTQRRSDLAQYRISLESFASNNNGLYPAYAASRNWASAWLCTQLSGYLSGCPEDPIGNSTADYRYWYQSDGTSNTISATQWVLWVKLEASGNYWEVCSNGKAGSIPTGTTLNTVGGNCQVP